MAAVWRGSRPLAFVVRTATVTPSLWPVAGVHAVAASASSERTHQTRRCSASAEASALAVGSLVAMSAYHASARSPSSYGRLVQVISPASAIASTDGVAPGDTRWMSAPAAMSAGSRLLGHLATAEDDDATAA